MEQQQLSPGVQALVTVLTQQRNGAQDALAQCNAQLIVAMEQIAAYEAEIAALKALALSKE